MNSVSLILRAIRQEQIPRFPVWMMRQAGRYLPEYRQMKEKYSFSELCLTPELSVEIALQPIRRYKFDASILFSDILIPASALGFKLRFNPGPVVDNPVTTSAQIKALSDTPDLNCLRPVFDAVSGLRKALPQETGLIGFAATPWTLACYLIDQRPFKHFERTIIWAQKEEAALKLLLDKLTRLTELYIREQVKAGAEIIQLFDSWGGVIPPARYAELSLNYTERVLKAASPAATILYLNGASPYIAQLNSSCADVISVDSRTELRAISPKKSVQGNLDPSVLFGKRVRESTEQMLAETGRTTGFIANLGHGVLQETPVEGVAEFVEAVKGYRV